MAREGVAGTKESTVSLRVPLCCSRKSKREVVSDGSHWLVPSNRPLAIFHPNYSEFLTPVLPIIFFVQLTLDFVLRNWVSDIEEHLPVSGRKERTRSRHLPVLSLPCTPRFDNEEINTRAKRKGRGGKKERETIGQSFATRSIFWPSYVSWKKLVSSTKGPAEILAAKFRSCVGFQLNLSRAR